MKDGQEVLDLTKLSNRVPDASNVYNYFPPAVKADPEESILPDFFGADCRINSNNLLVASDALDVNHPASLRPSDSEDAFSHQAVDGSFVAENLSDDSDSDTDSQQSGDHHGLLQALASSNHATGDIIPPGHAPLTTPEFLQFALLEALGGDVHEVEELLGENLAHDSDEDQDGDQFFHDQEMYDTNEDLSDSDDVSETGVTAYQVFDRMLPKRCP